MRQVQKKRHIVVSEDTAHLAVLIAAARQVSVAQVCDPILLPQLRKELDREMKATKAKNEPAPTKQVDS
jgi:hypothetical protein